MSGHTYTLLELNRDIRSSIESKFLSPVWLVAEINRINLHRSGHCYLELVQKSTKDDNIIATSRAVIWSSIYSQLKKYFESATGAGLTDGISVLIKVSVDFHEVYGISLNIRDIDPSYTLGDIAKRRKEIIDKLKAENVIELNKSLELPSPVKRIAVISSVSAAGYEDFINQLNNNKYDYKYDINLFEANMQGINTEPSVIQAFNNIFEKNENFDVVTIIRGGGSKTDLAAFDNYNIAFHITQFPIPVISGIGHERDDTVTDIVAHTKLKTPTAVANFIIDNTYKFENQITEIGNEIIDIVKDRIYINNMLLTRASMKISRLRNIITEKQENCNEFIFRLKHAVNNYIQLKNSKLELLNNKKHIYSKEIIKSQYKNLLQLGINFKTAVKSDIYNKNNKLENIENNIRLISPENILKRGFSITRHKGKIIKDAKSLAVNDEIETVFYKSGVVSRVERKK